MTASATVIASANESTPLWAALANELDIAPSLYEKAAARHKSLGEWLCRPESVLAPFRPNVRPQGSFRFGTVIKPLVEGASYDLDQVVVLESLRTQDLPQAELKERFGAELAGYADAHKMRAPEEKHRCWCLNYSDEVEFHLDSLPAVPATSETILHLRQAGVGEPWAPRAIAITDNRQPDYYAVGARWLTSNPRGFAAWFESQAARGRATAIGKGVRGSVEDVPPYAWRTPLQRAIQILKRHRDVMFQRKPDLAPISMIITNLSARAYDGEQDLGGALSGIVQRMDRFVNNAWPRVPNPTHPDEDYADKWRLRTELEANFWNWLEQVRADVRYFSEAGMDADLLERRLAIRLSEENQQRVARARRGAIGAPVIMVAPTIPRIDKAPPPWSER